MSLEEQAAARKARLAQLRGIKRAPERSEQSEQSEQSRESGDGSGNVEQETKVKPRNYDPEVKGPRLGMENNPVEEEETIEFVAEQQQKEALDKLTATAASDLDLSSLQPKSATWDLKRDLESQMQELDAQTDNSIIKMVRQRLLDAQEKN
uniref:ARAD1D18920p n=1 Tax=Blastobotrys adeninivorans TaxID=409370 RepID=A0A060TF10_BLAAD